MSPESPFHASRQPCLPGIAIPRGSQATRTDHDGLDRVIAVTDAQGAVVRHTYDANGNLPRFTDAKNNVTTLTYDARNRALTKRDALLKTESYSYDAAGNLALLTDRNGQVSGYERGSTGTYHDCCSSWRA